MKILLISSNTTTTPFPIYPFGVSIITAALTTAGHKVQQFDFLQQKNSVDAIGKEIKKFKPELIGISIRNIDNVNMLNKQYYIETVENIVKKIREVSNKKIILGGAGFSLIPDLILQKTGADYGIIGEGELSMLNFANNASKGLYPEERLIESRTRLPGTEISSAKYDKKLMQYYLLNGNIAPVQTKRGCTSRCVYCSYPILEGSRIRHRDPRSVVDDIELLRDKHKVKYIFFVDSVFNDNKGVYLGVIEEMIKRKINIPWTGFFKPKGLNDNIVQKMKQTGLAAVEFGSDAACNVTLKKLGKGFSFQNIIKTNDLFVKHGISASHYFMFGGPGETKKTVLEGINNIKRLKKCVIFIFMGIRILPDTPLARIAIKEKILSPGKGMLKPIYYISPSVDKNWLKKTLTNAFSKIRLCVFPPDSFDDGLKILHKLGYHGTLWDLLLRDKATKRNKSHAAK